MKKGIVKYNADALPLPGTGDGYKRAVEKIAQQITSAKKPVILAERPEDSTTNGTNTVKVANLLNVLLGNTEFMDFSQYQALSKTAYREDVHKFLALITNDHVKAMGPLA